MMLMIMVMTMGIMIINMVIMGVMTMIMLNYDCVESLDFLFGMIGHWTKKMIGHWG